MGDPDPDFNQPGYSYLMTFVATALLVSYFTNNLGLEGNPTVLVDVLFVAFCSLARAIRAPDADLVSVIADREAVQPQGPWRHKSSYQPQPCRHPAAAIRSFTPATVPRRAASFRRDWTSSALVLGKGAHGSDKLPDLCPRLEALAVLARSVLAERSTQGGGRGTVRREWLVFGGSSSTFAVLLDVC